MLVKKIVATLLTTLMLVIGSNIVRAGSLENAVTAYANGQYCTTLQIIRPLAEQGDPVAQFGLAEIYRRGQCVSESVGEAWKWYRLSREKGTSDAELRWHQLGAKQGIAEAQTILGRMYESGRGVKQDYREAMKWYRQAAEQGDAAAQSSLGALYAKGHGVIQDYLLAHMWSNIAASKLVGKEGELGEEGQRAANTRDSVAKNLTPTQVIQAQGMARQCEAKNFKGCN